MQFVKGRKNGKKEREKREFVHRGKPAGVDSLFYRRWNMAALRFCALESKEGKSVSKQVLKSGAENNKIGQN